MAYFVAIGGHGAESRRLFNPDFCALRVQKASVFNGVMMSSNFREIRKADYEMHSAPSFKFNRLQSSDRELNHCSLSDFNQVVVREAELEEELLAAAWLRAESHCEERVNDRYAQSYKKKIAEQEFHALRRQCKEHHGQNFKCIMAVMEERDVKQPAVNSVVGTLDLSFRYLLQGQTFPGERVTAPFLCNINMAEKTKYAYFSNVCVEVAARRQGIARKMMSLAIELTRTNGLIEVYVHVHRKNLAAQGMYQKLGFEIVELANSHLLAERTYLLRLTM